MMINSQLILGDFEKCKDPDLSIVIPTYGRAEYLEKAIDSALSQKAKGCTYEVLVVSNDPNDSLERIVAKYKNVPNFYLYRNESNIGMVGNSNRCAFLARGRYIAFLHDDDYLLENYIGLIEKYVLNDGKIKCFIPGRYIYFENDCSEYRNALKKRLLRNIYFIPSLYRKKIKRILPEHCVKADNNCYFSPSCGTVFEKKAFEEAGGFNADIVYTWDWDFFLNFNLKYEIYTCTEMCAVYRMAANASMRSEVKFDFYDYKRNQYMKFVKDNRICEKFVKKYENEMINSMYVQWPDAISEELKKRGEKLPTVDYKRMKWFKLRKMLYYYNHNLDIQRLMKR